MKQNSLRIATRESALAMWQAEHVAASLRQAHPELQVKLIGMTTEGDKKLDAPLAKIGGKGLFIKELEQGILEDRADIAVHSMKDVPVDFPDGLGLPIIMARGDPRDAFVSNQYQHLNDLPKGARVGTCSLRRQCQLAERYPEIQLINLRGNVNTRLRKLDEGEYDAIILAAAGLQRLGMADRITTILEPEFSLPAIGQGALGIECRLDDDKILKTIEVLDDPETHTLVGAERALNERLQGSCQVPIAGFAVFKGQGVDDNTNKEIYLRGLVGLPDGSQVIRAEISGPMEQAASLGTSLAKELLNLGAGEVLQKIYAAVS